MDETRDATRARRDFVTLVAGTAVFALLAVHFEFSERFLAFSKPHEHLQLDELPGILLVVACGLAWYAWRRVTEARTELLLRRSVELRLRRALAENRDLALAALRVQEEERRSLARELHDELGQHLNAIKIDAVYLRDGTSSRGREASSIVAGIDCVQTVIRDLMRRLRPPGLDELGLPAALEDCLDGWRRRLPAVQFKLTIDSGLPRLNEATSITLYRLLQEGLTNVAKHAQAALVEIVLTRDTASPLGAADVVLTMRDDGVGPGPQGSRGIGLIGMRERVEALGGRFEIAADRVRGFAFEARIPVAASEGA